MRKILITYSLLLITCFASADTPLKNIFGKNFLIGAAINDRQVSGKDGAVATKCIITNFNSVVAENCMKPAEVHPKQNVWRWDKADAFVNFGTKNKMAVIGHCLVWHQQTPQWFFKDKDGKDVSRDTLIQRMKDHIFTVMGRYKGRIKGWDVVNEAFNDDGSYRESPWYNIIGPEYIEMALRFAHEADPKAELYINDFNMFCVGKRRAVCRLVRRLKEKGVQLVAIGMQSHNGMKYPDLVEYEKSIEAFGKTGLKVMVTELDLNILPQPKGFGGGAEITDNFKYNPEDDPYRNGLTPEMDKFVNQRWIDLFNIYHRHKDVISRVCLWGVTDAQSWMNDWPVKGRTAYPLLFDRDYKQKPVVREIEKIFK